MYYREIERNGDLPADDRANSYSTFLLFIVLTFPGYGVSLYFSKFFVSAVRFRPFAFGKVLLVLPLARHFYTLCFSFQSPLFLLGRLFLDQSAFYFILEGGDGKSPNYH